MEPTTRVLVTVSPNKSPIHGRQRGFTIKACIPNTAGLKGAPAFRKPYLVDEAVFVDQSDADRFFRRLAEQGYYR